MKSAYSFIFIVASLTLLLIGGISLLIAYPWLIIILLIVLLLRQLR